MDSPGNSLLKQRWCTVRFAFAFNNLFNVQNENAELTEQVESLQKKLEANEEAATKASQEYKQLQQENENAVAKLKGVYSSSNRITCIYVAPCSGRYCLTSPKPKISHWSPRDKFPLVWESLCCDATLLPIVKVHHFALWCIVICLQCWATVFGVCMWNLSQCLSSMEVMSLTRAISLPSFVAWACKRQTTHVP